MLDRVANDDSISIDDRSSDVTFQQLLDAASTTVIGSGAAFCRFAGERQLSQFGHRSGHSAFGPVTEVISAMRLGISHSSQSALATKADLIQPSAA